MKLRCKWESSKTVQEVMFLVKNIKYGKHIIFYSYRKFALRRGTLGQLERRFLHHGTDYIHQTSNLPGVGVLREEYPHELEVLQKQGNSREQNGMSVSVG